MVGAIIRSVGSVSAGLIVALILVIGVEGMSSILHPFPAGGDPADFEACKAHVARYPAGVLGARCIGMGNGGIREFVVGDATGNGKTSGTRYRGRGDSVRGGHLQYGHVAVSELVLAQSDRLSHFLLLGVETRAGKANQTASGRRPCPSAN